MQQYLFNLSAVWLISLILFDLFLRKESYHTYNRTYLLSTFLLGILLPLFNLSDETELYSQRLQQPVEQLIAAKRTITTISIPQGDVFNWKELVLIIYFIGVIVALVKLVVDISKIVAFYRAGTKSDADGWKIIETGRAHAPFSFRKILFIADRSNYAPSEWQMILTHEQRHNDLLHIADLCVMQLSYIAFWFHPLVYIYNKRLLLVHEYQADKASGSDTSGYGRFLVEQAILQTAPAVAHSFNRSPIKNRLIMLTRTSTKAAKTKMLLIVPLTLVSAICFTNNGFSQRFERNGNFITYQGNKFEMSKSTTDSIFIIDPVTGKELLKIVQTDPKPIKMNGRDIAIQTDQSPYYTGSEKDLREYLLRNLKEELTKLDDGPYTLNIKDIVVDENGKIVYFDYQNMRRSKAANELGAQQKPSGPMIINSSDPKVTISINDPKTGAPTPMKLQRNSNPNNYVEIDNTLQSAIFKKVCNLMNTAPGFKPAMVNGTKVPGFYNSMRFYNHIKVEKHKIFDAQLDGTWKEL